MHGALVMAAAAIVVPAVAGSADRDPRFPLERGKLSKVAAIAASTGGEISLWTGTTPAGGRCTGLHVAGLDGLARRAAPNAGGACDIGPATEPRSIDAAVTWIRTDEGLIGIV